MPKEAQSRLKQQLKPYYHPLFENSGLSTLTDAFDLLGDWSSAGKCMPVDICETKKKFIVKAELAGVKKENIKVSYDKSILYIEAEKSIVTYDNDDQKDEESDSDEKKDSSKSHSEKQNSTPKYNTHVSEIDYGKFIRAISMPETCDLNSVSSKFENGVLILKFDKKKPESRKEIPLD